MLIEPPIPEREVDPAMLEEDRRAAITSIAPDVQSTPPAEVWRGTRTGLTRPTLASIHAKANTSELPQRPHPRKRHPLTHRSEAGSSHDTSGSESDETLVDSFTDKDVNDYLLSRTLAPNDVKRPEELVRHLKSGLGYSAEVLWILRPLLYGELLKTVRFPR